MDAEKRCGMRRGVCECGSGCSAGKERRLAHKGKSGTEALYKQNNMHMGAEIKSSSKKTRQIKIDETENKRFVCEQSRRGEGE